MTGFQAQATSMVATFRVGKLYFGIEVVQVQEVLRFCSMTSVPLSPPSVSGLLNLRGQIITALDVRGILRMGPRPEEQRPTNIVVHACEETVSLLVDSVGDVLELQEKQFEPVPETIPEQIRSVVRGVYKLDDELLLLLDAAACVNIQ